MSKTTLSLNKDVFVFSKKTGAGLTVEQTDAGQIKVTCQDVEVVLTVGSFNGDVEVDTDSELVCEEQNDL